MTESQPSCISIISWAQTYSMIHTSNFGNLCKHVLSACSSLPSIGWYYDGQLGRVCGGRKHWVSAPWVSWVRCDHSPGWTCTGKLKMSSNEHPSSKTVCRASRFENVANYFRVKLTGPHQNKSLFKEQYYAITIRLTHVDFYCEVYCAVRRRWPGTRFTELWLLHSFWLSVLDLWWSVPVTMEA